MKNIYIINARHAYPFAPGQLNDTLAVNAKAFLENLNYETRYLQVDNGWQTQQELENHKWADTIILQSPVNWMGVPWTFKQYMDEVYTAGMDGSLCNGDGRTSDAPKNNYGAGGSLTGKNYMLSLTFNAPEESFNDTSEYLFQGKTVDDLFFPMHMNFRFFGMEALETFACYDVMKNADVDNDLRRFEKHLETVFT